MKMLLPQLAELTALGQFVAVSTVVETVGSSPREVGASMALTQEGKVLGSLSGGCLEADVLQAAGDVLMEGAVRSCSYGPADSEDLFAVGLTCGGFIDVVTRRFGPQDAADLARISDAVNHERNIVFATVTNSAVFSAGILGLDAGEAFGSLGNEDLDAAVLSQLPGLLNSGWTGTINLGLSGRRDQNDVAIFVESYIARPKMLIVGAIDLAGALAAVAKNLGFHTTIVDPRSAFATAERFSNADDVVAAWPHTFFSSWDGDERSVVCILNHDPRIDVPVALEALRSPAFYVGAMGSSQTHFDRLERLAQAGATADEISRLHSPIGLDIGAKSPAEIAISIVGEIIAARTQSPGSPMKSRTAVASDVSVPN